jgi:hypothetical protein
VPFLFSDYLTPGPNAFERECIHWATSRARNARRLGDKATGAGKRPAQISLQMVVALKPVRARTSSRLINRSTAWSAFCVAAASRLGADDVLVISISRRVLNYQEIAAIRSKLHSKASENLNSFKSSA